MLRERLDPPSPGPEPLLARNRLRRQPDERGKLALEPAALVVVRHELGDRLRELVRRLLARVALEHA